MAAEDRYSSLPAALEDQSGEAIGSASDCTQPACLSRKAFNPPLNRFFLASASSLLTTSLVMPSISQMMLKRMPAYPAGIPGLHNRRLGSTCWRTTSPLYH